MRLVVQRVRCAEVKINGKTVSKIGKGLVVFIGIKRNDTIDEAKYLAGKLSRLRVFENDEGKVGISPLEINAEMMVVSQFTLYGDTQKGRRPDFSEAAPPELAKELYEKFIDYLLSCGLKVKSGVFGERMEVIVSNDGPFTIIMEKER
jgi:D-tyrosyl-tRNA(Tyr) deacylase